MLHLFLCECIIGIGCDRFISLHFPALRQYLAGAANWFVRALKGMSADKLREEACRDFLRSSVCCKLLLGRGNLVGGWRESVIKSSDSTVTVFVRAGMPYFLQLCSPS